MRRVLLLCTALEGGGAEAQVRLLAVELRCRGWDVGVLSMLPAGGAGDELTAAGVEVLSLDMRPGKPDPHSLLKLALAFYRFRPEILHSHLFHANLLARVARLFWPSPVVISTVHSLAESGRNSKKVRGRDLAYRLTGCLADATTFVCTAAAERHLAAHAVRKSEVRVIPNGVDVDVFRPAAERRAGDRFVWLAAGRLIWKKDYATLLRAFAGLGNGELWIAGEGPDEAELRALAVGLSADVRFLGAVSAMPRLMQSADAFVLSSQVEGLPMALLEAAACGLPAVATAAGGVRDIVVDGVTGFVVPPGDPDALSAAMRRLSGLRPEARSLMGHSARERAVSRFDIRRVVSEWERLYSELWESAP